MSEITERVAARSNQLQEEEDRTTRELSRLATHHQENKDKQEELRQKLSTASKRHNFFASLRVFLVDVAACLTEKRPMILDLAKAQRKIRRDRLHLLHKQQEHDLEDVVTALREQLAHSTSTSTDPICVWCARSNQATIRLWNQEDSITTTTTTVVVDEFGRSSSVADAPGSGAQKVRMQLRRLRWEQRDKRDPWHELDNQTRDEISSKERESGVFEAAKVMFADVRVELRDVVSLRSRFQSWACDYRDDFEMTFGGLSMPEIFEWYARVALLQWHPLKTTNNALGSGEKGERGERGEKGERGERGERGENEREREAKEDERIVSFVLKWSQEETEAMGSESPPPAKHWSRTERLVQASLVRSCVAPHVLWHVNEIWNPSIVEETACLVRWMKRLKRQAELLESDADWSKGAKEMYKKMENGIAQRLEKEIGTLRIPLLCTSAASSSSASSSSSPMLPPMRLVVDEMFKHCLQNHVGRIGRIACSLIRCRVTMTETRCRTLLLEHLGHNLLVQAVRHGSSSVDYQHSLMQLFETMEEPSNLWNEFVSLVIPKIKLLETEEEMMWKQEDDNDERNERPWH